MDTVNKWLAALDSLALLLKSKWLAGSRTMREVLYGMTVHELHVELKKEQSHIHNLFMLVVFGDLVGLPLLPPYYSMRLLPYILPHVEVWKRSLLRERDLSDRVSMDL